MVVTPLCDLPPRPCGNNVAQIALCELHLPAALVDRRDDDRGRAVRDGRRLRHHRLSRSPEPGEDAGVKLQQVAVHLLGGGAGGRFGDVATVRARPVEPLVDQRAGRAGAHLDLGVLHRAFRPFLPPAQRPGARRVRQVVRPAAGEPHVANVVDYNSAVLAFHRPQRPPELLDEQRVTGRRPRHAHHLDCREVEPLAEQIDVDELQQLPPGEAPQDRRPYEFGGIGADHLGRHARRPVPRRRFGRYFHGDTERNPQFPRGDPQVRVNRVPGDVAAAGGVGQRGRGVVAPGGKRDIGHVYVALRREHPVIA